ncbi:hypothetical protein AK812_SmicGene2611 [Symbiodinium microadriaticum]|uniref:Uncharacterized protein n=1 Tax=Symbiodinium microadriaticum TaxID=2951 RepID=A0A1Q9F168_SYMMI|nr:hypothetical protein AK812_SmicGene2611 [Symbiodinium microadriaticum]
MITVLVSNYRNLSSTEQSKLHRGQAAVLEIGETRTVAGVHEEVGGLEHSPVSADHQGLISEEYLSDEAFKHCALGRLNVE